MSQQDFSRFKDYYQILALEPGASLQDIRKNYRKLARKYHPDTSQSHSSQEKFQEIQEAYEVLSEPERAQTYMRLFRMFEARMEAQKERDRRRRQRSERRIILYCKSEKDLAPLEEFTRQMEMQWGIPGEGETWERIQETEGKFERLDGLVQDMHSSMKKNQSISGFEYTADLIFMNPKNLGENLEEALPRIHNLLNDRGHLNSSYLCSYALYCLDFEKALWIEDRPLDMARFLKATAMEFAIPMHQWPVLSPKHPGKIDNLVLLARMVQAELSTEWIEKTLPHPIKRLELTPLIKFLGT